MSDRSAHLALWIIVTMIVVGLSVCVGTFIALMLFRGITLLRGVRPCEDCGRRFCVVEVKRDLSLEHKGFFE